MTEFTPDTDSDIPLKKATWILGVSICSVAILAVLALTMPTHVTVAQNAQSVEPTRFYQLVVPGK